MAECKLIMDLTLFYNDEVLLVKYKDNNKYDLQKGWFLPDDVIHNLEHPDDASKRILSEQLNLSNIVPSINHFESFTGNDKSWHLVFHYKVLLNEKPEINPSGDIETCQWFKLGNLPHKKEVAHHGWALYTINNCKT